MSVFKEPISECIWDIKYRYRQDEKIIDTTIEDSWHRVAMAVAKAEKRPERKYWYQSFYDLLADFKFLPGGRILAGAGTHRYVTLLNCFVMKIKKDSLRDIFEGLSEGALTLQEGGGIGYDFSIIRPSGEKTTRSGSIASGPVSFMHIWDSMSSIMQSSGARRGAMMGHLRCDHPDIEKFIAAKSDPTKLRHFNVSVIVTDAFMKAVKDDKDWPLVFPLPPNENHQAPIIYQRWSGTSQLVPCKIHRYIKARELWQNIIKAAYTYAEPGVIFEDTINRFNPLWYSEWISATNPCGEIPLPHYGACDLGSINLTQFIINPFTNSAKINWRKLKEITAVATRFLDNVIDISKYPLTMQKQMALNTRRIGLGFTGLGDLFVLLGVQYGDSKSLKIAKKIMQTICHVTWETSCELANEKGSFPFLRKKSYLKGEFVQSLPQEIRHCIMQQGMRNSHHNAIAPAGTISLLANNVSNGLEPIFSKEYERKVRTADDIRINFHVQDYAYRLWKEQSDKEDLPPGWTEVQKLTPQDHLQIQSAVQPFIDNAISKTINLPEDFPFEKLTEIYTEAYKMGLKGCTIYRPNPITGSVLSAEIVDQCCPTK